mgnify:CR=1 FL=1
MQRRAGEQPPAELQRGRAVQGAFRHPRQRERERADGSALLRATALGYDICARASLSLCTMISMVRSALTTMGRFDSVCGDTGMSEISDSDGCTIGPPADSA